MSHRRIIKVVLFLSLTANILIYFTMDKHLKDRHFNNGDRFSGGQFNKDLNLLPNDTEIDKMGEDNLTLIYWKYINSLQVLCRNQMRMGNMGDGGKEVCLDEKYKPKYPCLVYSFGSNFEFSFEMSIIKHFNCTVYTFDPTVNITDLCHSEFIWLRMTKINSIKRKHIPKGINFHLIGLSNNNSTYTKGWKMQTLSSIRKMLNHTERILDILKIDIEGGEWNALPEILQSGVLKYVKQLCIEVHFGKENWAYLSSKNQLKILMDLYENGFRIFMREHNVFTKMSFKQPYETITSVNEISLINKRF